MVHKEVCRRLSIAAMPKSDEMIDETRELSRMLGGLMDRVQENR